MARKPIPPQAILRIEGLSTGIDPTAVDDFTGKALAQPNAVVPRDLPAERDVRKRKDAADQYLALQLLGLVPMTDSALLVQQAMKARADSALQKPKFKVNGPVVHSNGRAFELVLPRNPLRRI